MGKRKNPAMEGAQAAFGKAQEAMDGGDAADVLKHGREALRLVGEGGEECLGLLPTAHMIIGYGLFHQGDHEGARQAYEEMFKCHESGPLKDLDEMQAGISSLSTEFFEAGKGDLVRHWFDWYDTTCQKEKGGSCAMPVDGYISLYLSTKKHVPGSDPLPALDKAYEAALRDPYGYVLSDRSHQMLPEYVEAGAAARALAFVEKAIELTTERYKRDLEKGGESAPESFLGDVNRFVTFREEFKKDGTVPRPVVTLQSQRASLLLELGRIDEAVEACQVVAAAREVDSRKLEAAKAAQKKGPADKMLGMLKGAFGGAVSVSPMAALSTADVYQPWFLYTYGEALRRKGDKEGAAHKFDIAMKTVDEDEDEELADKIKAAMAQL